MSGVPLRAVKSFLSRIPDVFTGEDLVQWLMKFYGVDTNDEAVHLGNHNTVATAKLQPAKVRRPPKLRRFFELVPRYQKTRLACCINILKFRLFGSFHPLNNF